jgi:hypothetical protein
MYAVEFLVLVEQEKQKRYPCFGRFVWYIDIGTAKQALPATSSPN